MKKLLVLFVALGLSLTLMACGGAAEPTHDYYVVGNFNSWGEAIGDETYQMEVVSYRDERLASIKDELKDAEEIYIYELALPTEEAGWGKNFIIDGVNTTVDGNKIIKVVRTDLGDAENGIWWAQSPESGKIDNLTTETFWIPEFVEEATTTNIVGEGDDAVLFTSGAWNDDSVALDGGTYYVVFAEFDGSRAMGLIEVPAE